MSDDLWGGTRWWINGFTDGADPEYEQTCSPPSTSTARRVLDIGCGEGHRPARHSPALRRAVGATPPPTNRCGDPRGGPSYARAAAGALPFASGRFDAAIACLVFEHIRDVDDALAEVGRVLAPGGRFLFFLNHPLLQTPNSGWIDDQVLDPPEQYWRIGSYLVEDETIEVEKNVFIPFIHRPLSRYVNARGRRALRAPHGRAGTTGRFSRPGIGVSRRGDDPAAVVPVGHKDTLNACSLGTLVRGG